MLYGYMYIYAYVVIYGYHECYVCIHVYTYIYIYTHQNRFQKDRVPFLGSQNKGYSFGRFWGTPIPPNYHMFLFVDIIIMWGIFKFRMEA